MDGNSCVCGRRTQAGRGGILGVGRRRMIHWIIRVKSFGTTTDPAKRTAGGFVG